MSHVCARQFIHILCATKNLEHKICIESKDQFQGYISSIIQKSDGQCLATSSTTNHVHLLINLPTNISLSAILSKVKASSSKWYHQRDERSSDFAWSNGYLAFTVSPASLTSAKKYFSQEYTRHATTSVEDEIRQFLHIQEVEFKPQYLTSTTYSRLIFHLVWSVKDRTPLLEKSLKSALHEVFSSEIEKLHGNLIAAGNVSDHIHLLLECPKTLAMADLVNKLKTTTTSFLRKESQKFRNASWQPGYGVFSVGKPALKNICAYVHNQEEHHGLCSLDEEWKQLLTLI